jgi:hypothetical protein
LYYAECTDVAEKYGVSPAVLKKMIEATIKERKEKKPTPESTDQGARGRKTQTGRQRG